MHSSSQTGLVSKTNLTKVMILMSISGYPCHLLLEEDDPRIPKKGFEGICLGTVYSNSFAMMQRDYDLVRETIRVVEDCYTLVNDKSNFQSLIDYFQRNEIKEDIKKRLKNYMDSGLLYSYIKGERASAVLQEHFARIAGFQQSILDPALKSTGVQIPSNKMDQLMPAYLKTLNKKVYNAHPLLAIVNPAQLSKLLKTLESELLKYASIKASKENIVFSVMGTVYKETEKNLSCKAAHNILLTFDPSKKGNKWIVLRADSHYFIESKSTKETAMEILSEFTCLSEHHEFSRGLCLLPMTMDLTLHLSVNGAVKKTIHALPKLVDPQFFLASASVSQPFDSESDEESSCDSDANDDPNTFNFSKFQNLLYLFLESASASQIKQYFTLPQNKMLLQSDFFVKTEKINGVTRWNVLDAVLIARFFEKGTPEVLSALLECGAVLSQQNLNTFCVGLPRNFDYLAEIASVHVQAAHQSIQWLMANGLDLCARMGTSNCKNSPTLLGHFAMTLVDKYNCSLVSNSAYMLTVIDALLQAGSDPHLIMDFSGSNHSADQISLVNKLSIQLTRMKESQHALCKTLEQCITLFKSHVPAPASTASTASTLPSSSSTDQAGNDYLEYIKALLQDASFLKNANVFISTSILTDTFHKQIYPPILEKIRKIIQNNVLDSTQKVSELKALFERHIRKIEDGKESHNAHPLTVEFMWHALSEEELKNYFDVRYAKPAVISQQKL